MFNFTRSSFLSLLPMVALARTHNSECAPLRRIHHKLLNFLRTWILEHIVKVDKKCGVYIESRGGRFMD